MPVNLFIQRESLGGLLLIVAAALAMVLANSPAKDLYGLLLSTPVSIQLGDFEVAKPLLGWVNQVLMTVFFFLVGLKIKREFHEGGLSTPAQIRLSLIAALGGMAVPALIYITLNAHDPVAVRGWGIPMSTDLAFALAVLVLLRDRVPQGLKMLLLSIALVDDIGALLVLALYYTGGLTVLNLVLGLGGLCGALLMNRMGVTRISAYILPGMFTWACLVESGLHAAFSGALLGLTIPTQSRSRASSPLVTLKQALHPWVAYMLMPIFAFANAGVALDHLSPGMVDDSVSLGIMLGLFAGKPAGILTFIALGVISGFCRLPDGVTWRHIFAMALLAGIGFTMSLFKGVQAFDAPALVAQMRLAVLVASTCSAVAGFLFLRFGTRPSSAG